LRRAADPAGWQPADRRPRRLKQFRSGQQVLASGVVSQHAGRRQLSHPDFEILDPQGDPVHTGRLVPVYGLTHGIGQHWLRRLVHDTLAALRGQLPESLPAEVRERHGLCDRSQALAGIHFPRDDGHRDAARRRLVFEELLLVQLAMALRRREHRRRTGVVLPEPGDLTARLVASLPFKLTRSQRHVLVEILADLRSGRAMHRLLQGDVGSGKTIVALIAALFVIERGYQALILAPTEVLAQQHGATLRRLCEPLGVEVATLTGGTPAAARREILAAAAEGRLPLLTGTHALLSEPVELPRLALAVVDEQHRFGVRQRGRPAHKSSIDEVPHVLVMSATPIPRSLALTLYGDLDLSTITELPPGRQPITTRLVTDQREERVYAECREFLDRGQQAYVVYPVIEQTEGQDLKAATAEFARLQRGPFAGRRLALLHGRLKPAEKNAVMAGFAAGEIDLLVATTVVEVGVDVPNANVMIIHNPERFGLAQLHQLRGRIGRRRERAVCSLVYDRLLPEETVARLQFFATHGDGFALAEEDLRRRGPGDLWGERQHGVPGFRIANPLRDRELQDLCAAEAERILRADPRLTSPAGRALHATLTAVYGKIVPLAAG
jgi:ATP-dependent DNA helicase RecG